ncbi:hypothetical protein P3T23_009861 [Paraburkholderia sp. GAS448]
MVPDNLKSGVHKPGFYDPDINPTYQEMARHYSVTAGDAHAYNQSLGKRGMIQPVFSRR